MEFLKGLKNNNKIKVNIEHEDMTPEFNGQMLIKKGMVSVRITWWSRVDMRQIGSVAYPTLDTTDYDIQSETISIENVPIDDVKKFREGLKNNGMESISKELTISDEEIRTAIIESIPNNKEYKRLFGDMPFWNTLSEAEKQWAILAAIMQNPKENQNYMYWYKTQFGWVDGGIPLTNAEVIAKYYNNEIKIN